MRQLLVLRDKAYPMIAVVAEEQAHGPEPGRWPRGRKDNIYDSHESMHPEELKRVG